MSTQEFFPLSFFALKTRLGFADKSLFYQFVRRAMFGLAGSSWLLVVSCLCCVFGSIIRYLSRFRAEDSWEKVDLLRERKIGSDCVENPDADEKGESESSVVADTVSTASASKCQFICGKDFSRFIEEPQSVSFTVQELYVSSNYGSISNNPDPNTYKKFEKDDLEIVDLNHVKGEDSFQNLGGELNLEDHAKAEDSSECCGGGIDLEAEAAEDPVHCIDTLLNLEAEDGNHTKTEESAGSVNHEQEQEVFGEDGLSKRGGMVGPENDFLGRCHSSSEVSDSNQDLSNSGDEFVIPDHVCNSVNDESFLVRDLDEWLEEETFLPRVMYETEEENPSNNTSFLDQQPEVKDIEEEYSELESQLQSSNPELYSENDGGKVEDRYKNEQFTGLEGTNKVNILENSDEPLLQKSPSSSDSDDESRWEDLWEHGNLIEQLKLELKNVRTGGLPTILEESESPKIVGDLKPLKIEEKFEHKDRMDRIQKFYKRYADKMRKLDILNYQTVNAIGFLQLKDSAQLSSKGKPSASAIKSLLSQKASKLKRLQDGPTLNLIRELKNNLEIIYVGQICLSWEILHWQYGKALELQESDPDCFGQYSQVTSEFEQFQVLVQRFLENEPFQGPRVQCYVKNRCLVHKLLQVPAIKDDCFKDKKGRAETGQDAVTIPTLIEAIEKSMRAFWDFLRADKDESGLRGSQVDLQNPADIELLTGIQTDLQKKDKRVKDLLRSKNCIVKRLQKHREDRLDRSLLSAQVEMKLVSRTLNMSRLTTDQLSWCHKKLCQINIVNRKFYVEPSFLLFP